MPPSPKTLRALDYMGHDQQQMIQVIHYCILDICFHSFDFTLLRSWNCPTDCTRVEYVFMAEVYHLFKGNLGINNRCQPISWEINVWKAHHCAESTPENWNARFKNGPWISIIIDKLVILYKKLMHQTYFWYIQEWVCLSLSSPHFKQKVYGLCNL